MLKDYEFMLSDEQLDLRDMIRDFAQNKVKDVCIEAEKAATVPEDLVKTAMDMELNLLTVPEEYGGAGLNKWTYAIMREELSRGDSAFASRVFGFGWDPLEIAGNEWQKEWVAGLMQEGGVLAFGLTESKAGSDAGGITGFLLPKDTPGFTVSNHEDKMGIRCVHTNSLFFDNVELDEKYRLGEEGEGFKIALKILGVSRPATASSAVGVAQSALDEAVKYAKQRKVFGKEIWKHEGVGFMLADMEMRTQAARQLVWGACRSADEGKNNLKLSSIAKCYTGDTAMYVAENAV